MERFVKRDNCWIEANSIRMYAAALVGRMGGDIYAWEKAINSMMSNQMIVFERRQGKPGYRTLKEAERPQSGTTPSFVHGGLSAVTA